MLVQSRLALSPGRSDLMRAANHDRAAAAAAAAADDDADADDDDQWAEGSERRQYH